MDEPVTTKKKCPFPFNADDLGALADTYGELRDHDPVPEVTLPSGDTAYLITRYADAQAVLGDRRFSSDIGRPEAARLREGSDGNFTNPYIADRAWHLRWRKLLTRAFTPQQVETMRDSVQAIAHELAEEMAGRERPVDLLQAFAFQLPARGISELLGIPVLEQQQVRGWVDALATSREADFSERAEAGMAMWQYSLGLIADKRAHPGEHLIDRLIAVHDDEDGKLSEDELVMTIIALIVGNNENTARQLGQGMFILLNHPDQLAELRADRSLLPSAIEEILRATPVYTALPRFATEEVQLGEKVIPCNATVLVARDSAQHDDRWIDEPHTFDIRRRTPTRHLAFGHGPSFCIGASFARLQMSCGFTALLDRFPDLALAVPPEEVSWTYRLLGSGAKTIPVTW
ncbi:cytochrome P450 [Amycolatopsis sp. NPDC059657]|uniref:cytochrome P450 n=1 Tax=Amycolatopsis sp. NPDC059657 TaxID=3346899 RepID=UPI00366DA0FF